MVQVLSHRHILPEPALLPLYERVLARLDPEAPDRGLLLAYYGTTKGVYSRGDREGSSALAEALRLARLHGDQWLEMRVLWFSAIADMLRRESTFADQYARLTRAAELARRPGDVSDEVWIQDCLVGELLGRGLVQEATELAGRMGETAERQGDRIDRLRARSAELGLAYHGAQWGTVRELSSELLERSPPQRLGVDGRGTAAARRRTRPVTSPPRSRTWTGWSR
jgi:hypothetical protein